MTRLSPASPHRLDLPGSGGLRLAADRWGDQGDPIVLFLHGAGQSRQAWDDTARAVVAAGWQAITVDHRGHGQSEWPQAADYEFDDFASDIMAVLDHFDTPPVVVGASLGGMSALLAQARTKDQLYRALVLVDVTPRLELSGVQRVIGFMAAHAGGFDTLDQASEIIATYTGRPTPATADGLRRVLRQDEIGRWQWHWDVRFLEGRIHMILEAEPDTVRHDPLRERLHEGAHNIRIPTLVVRGAQSDLVSAEGVREFVDAVPGARYIDVADAGHMVAGDQNDQFGAAVLGFLDGLSQKSR